MIRLTLAAALTALMTVPAFATDTAKPTAVEIWQADPTVILDAADVVLEDFLWIARPVIIFADTPADPAFTQQVELLRARIEELVERDVVLITDTSRADPSAVRKKLRPRGFQLTLVGKDGRVALRKPFPWNVRELTRSIDKMPMRQQEMHDAR
jgi:hypothetical protein